MSIPACPLGREIFQLEAVPDRIATTQSPRISGEIGGDDLQLELVLGQKEAQSRPALPAIKLATR
jgi:hypothetical protein